MDIKGAAELAENISKKRIANLAANVLYEDKKKWQAEMEAAWQSDMDELQTAYLKLQEQYKIAKVSSS